jgi:hypothetical protein
MSLVQQTSVAIVPKISTGLMSKLLYFIVAHHGHCHITFQNQHYGPYESPLQAFQTAVDWALDKGQEGHDTQVVLQRDGEFVVLWRYGDAYPPTPQ